MMTNEKVKTAREWVGKLSASLLEQYEVSCLQGEKIADLLAEFDVNEIKIKKCRKWSLISFLLIFACTVTCFLAMVYCSLEKIRLAPGVSLVVWIFICFALMAMWLITVEKFHKGHTKTSEEITTRLSHFIVACEALKCPTGRMDNSYDQKGVARNFVAHARRIIEAEDEFNKIRMLPELDLWQLENKIAWLKRVKKEFGEAGFILISCFNITLSNKLLFKKAHYELDHSFHK